jgi:hypothetical protein
MHSDDLVLNIATPRAHQPPSAHLTSAQTKRNKYSFSAKKERASNSRRKDQFDYNLLPVQGQEKQEERPKHAERSGEDRSIKRERNN